MSLYQQRHWQPPLKRGQNEGRLMGFLDFTRQEHRAVQLWTCTIPQEKKDAEGQTHQQTQGQGCHFKGQAYLSGFSGPGWPFPRTSGVGSKQWVAWAGPPQRAKGSGNSPSHRVMPPQWAWREEHQDKEDCSQALRLNGISLAGFWTHMGSITFSFQFPPSGTHLSNRCLPSHHILEAHNFSDVTVSQLERSFALE